MKKYGKLTEMISRKRAERVKKTKSFCIFTDRRMLHVRTKLTNSLSLSLSFSYYKKYVPYYVASKEAFGAAQFISIFFM